jgi:hypothetical protein
MTTESWANALKGFLAGSSGAVVIEAGAVTFDLEHTKYSVFSSSKPFRVPSFTDT